MTPRAWERYKPHITALAVGGVALAFGTSIPRFPGAIATAGLTFGIVVAGFTATQRTMLFGISARQSLIMQYLIKTERYDDILSFLKQGILSGLVMCVVSVAFFFLNCLLQETALAWMIWIGVWSGSMTFVLICLLRNEQLMFIIVRQFMRDSDQRDS